MQVFHAEEALKAHGIRQVRVRHHGTIARIEVEPRELPRLIQSPLKDEIINTLKALGFTYVSVDLAGYRTGSMNEVLHHEQ